MSSVKFDHFLLIFDHQLPTLLFHETVPFYLYSWWKFDLIFDDFGRFWHFLCHFDSFLTIFDIPTWPICYHCFPGLSLMLCWKSVKFYSILVHFEHEYSRVNLAVTLNHLTEGGNIYQCFAVMVGQICLIFSSIFGRFLTFFLVDFWSISRFLVIERD
jgi:hypothetical protein